MSKQCLKRKPSIQNYQQFNPPTPSAQKEPKTLHKSPSNRQLIQQTLAKMHSLDDSSSNNNNLLVVLNKNQQNTQESEISNFVRHNLRHSTETVSLQFKDKENVENQNQTTKANRIHHLSLSKASPFAQMFYGRAGIRGQNYDYFYHQKLLRSYSQQKLNAKILFGSHQKQASFYPALGRSLSETKQLKSLELKRENHLTVLQKNSYSKQSEKENKEQELIIQNLLNKAKSKIKKSQLFKLSGEKQRILDIKVRGRIKSDIGQKKLMQRIEKACEKMKSVSEEKQKSKLSKGKLPRQELQHKPKNQQSERMTKFKFLIGSKGTKKLTLA